MALPQTPRLTAALIFALLAAVYVFDLANSPVYLGGDEVHFGVGAYSIATSGRNLHGDLFPLFVNLADPLGGKPMPWGDTWYQPFLFYVTALAVKVLPLTVATVRLPAALIAGLLTPLLTYFVALRLIGRVMPAFIAALIVGLAPTHVVLGRQALDYTCPLPFMLGWLWCLYEFTRTRDIKFAAFAGLILGAGCYSYIASWAMMPLYLLITWAVMLQQGSGIRPVVVSAIGFAVPVSLAPVWIWFHPQMLTETIARYGISEGPRYGPLATYWSLFDPIVWFVRGGASPTTSTARSGFVLLPVALLLVMGLVASWRRRGWITWVLLIGIVTAPIPAAFKGEPSMIQRALFLLPFIALLGGIGFSALWASRSRLARAAAIGVLVLAPVQFGYFYYDYFTHYKLRSAFYYDPAAFRDVADYLMASKAPAFFFTSDVDDASVKWRFYTIAHARTELLPLTQYIEPEIRPLAPPQSVLVTYVENARIDALIADGWAVEKVISDVDNRPAAAILRKRG